MKPYMVKQVITFSDGSETVLNYKQNMNGEQIEKEVAEAVELNQPVVAEVEVEIEPEVETEEIEEAEEVVE